MESGSKVESLKKVEPAQTLTRVLLMAVGDDGQPTPYRVSSETGNQINGTPSVIPVSQGGTSLTTLTDGAFVVGNGTGAVSLVGPGTAGQIPVSQGAGADPIMKTMSGDATLSSAGALTLATYMNFGGRLTLTSGTAVTTSDVTAATTVYYTPYIHNRVPIYASSAWTLRTFTERSLSLSGFTASRPVDIFIYDNSGTLTLEATAWTSATARATALTTQDGVYVRNGDTTRIYLGTICMTSSTGQCEDSNQSRLVWNMYNRVARPLRRHETTASWNYNSSTFQQANASTNNQVNVLVGLAETMVDLQLIASASHSSGGSALVSCLAEDWVSGSPTTGYSETAFAHHFIPNANNLVSGHARLTKYPAIGRHSYVWIERNTSGATGTFYGSSADILRTGITGSIAC